MAQSKKNNQHENEKLDSRWWEFYLVRYFVGTIVGALIILFLANSKRPLIGYQDQFPAELTNFYISFPRSGVGMPPGRSSVPLLVS
jgi:uncharacterized membrane-anchored protein YhcB (DUF1043 family)